MKIRKATFGLMMAASFALAGQATAANMLADASFESLDTSGGDQPGALLADWSTFNDVFISSQSAPALDGNNVMKIFGPFVSGGGAGAVQGGFAASAGQLWEASVFAMDSTVDPIGAGNFGVVKVEFLDGGGNVIGFAESAQHNSSATDDVWTFLSAQGVAPVGTVTAQIVLVHVQTDPISGGSIFFDSASLDIVPEPGSLALLGLGGLAMLRRRR